jgi:hypothetical protein
MSDYQTRKHNLDITRNTRLQAVNKLSAVITDIIYISTAEEIENTPIEKEIDSIALELERLNHRIRLIKI